MKQNRFKISMTKRQTTALMRKDRWSIINILNNLEKLLVEKAIADVLLQKTSVNINDSGKTNVTIEFDGYRAAEAFFKNKVLW